MQRGGAVLSGDGGDAAMAVRCGAVQCGDDAVAAVAMAPGPAGRQRVFRFSGTRSPVQPHLKQAESPLFQTGFVALASTP